MVVLLAAADATRAATGATRSPSAGPATATAPAWIRHPTQPFSISSTEITVAQFRACVASAACTASAVNPQCNYDHADRASHPVNCVTYDGAAQYCASIDGRICTEEEWLEACRGADGRPFPYGTTFDLAACNVQSDTTTVPDRARGTAPVGSHPHCVGGVPGLVDMAGNVAEWVNSCNGSYCKFRGAGYLSNDPVDLFAGCSGACSGNDKGFQSGVVGIRCCQTLSE